MSLISQFKVFNSVRVFGKHIVMARLKVILGNKWGEGISEERPGLDLGVDEGVNPAAL